MGTIKRLGAPSRNLKASVGDIYIDLKTGNKYQCTFAYVLGGTYDCDWKLVDAKTQGGLNNEEKTVVKEEVIVEETPSVDEAAEVVEEVVEEPIQQPKRTDYAAYSKNKKKK